MCILSLITTFFRIKEAQQNVQKITAEKKVETKKVNANSLVSARARNTHTQIYLSTAFSSFFQHISYYRKRGWNRGKQTCRPAENKKGAFWGGIISTTFKKNSLHRSATFHPATMFCRAVATMKAEICVFLFLWTWKCNEELYDSSENFTFFILTCFFYRCSRLGKVPSYRL